MEIQMNRDELLVTLQENREKHVSIYEEAKGNWAKKIKARAEEYIEHVSNTDAEEIRPPDKFFDKLWSYIPRSHRKEYDRAIKMVGHHVGSFVTLHEHEYENYVENKWKWTHSFNITAQNYTTDTMYLSSVE